MVRILNFFCVALMGLSILALYHVSEKTRVAHMQMNQAVRQIAQERAHIGVLETEWQHVASPERIQQLAQIVSDAQGPAALRHAIHPATRTFQALRIHVNDELGELERGLDASLKILKPHGRLVVVSFHSLEDRIAKQFLNSRSSAAPRGSRHAPVSAPRHAAFELLTTRPRTPSAEELSSNPRARSAKLRAGLKLAA